MREFHLGLGLALGVGATLSARADPPSADERVAALEQRLSVQLTRNLDRQHASPG